MVTKAPRRAPVRGAGSLVKPAPVTLGWNCVVQKGRPRYRLRASRASAAVSGTEANPLTTRRARCAPRAVCDRPSADGALAVDLQLELSTPSVDRRPEPTSRLRRSASAAEPALCRATRAGGLALATGPPGERRRQPELVGLDCSHEASLGRQTALLDSVAAHATSRTTTPGVCEHHPA